MSVATLLELLRSGAEELASQPVAEAEFHAALTELVAGTLRAVRKPKEKELRVPWMKGRWDGKGWRFEVNLCLDYFMFCLLCFEVLDRFCWGGEVFQR